MNRLRELRKRKGLTAEELAGLLKVSVRHFYKRVIEEGRMDKKGGPLSAASVIYHHRVLRRILEVAYKQGIIPRNVADQVDLPIPNDDDDEKDRGQLPLPSLMLRKGLTTNQ